MWDLNISLYVLAGPVRGISIAPSGDVAVSCSTDCSVRLFRLPFAPFEIAGDVADEASAVMEFQGKHAFRGIDHHWSQNKFATAGAQASHYLAFDQASRAQISHILPVRYILDSWPVMCQEALDVGMSTFLGVSFTCLG